jgi:hypothetical protein
MKKTENAPKSLEKLELLNVPELKNYHTPQIIEWGNLQELTRGSNLEGDDGQGSFSLSAGVGKMFPTPPIDGIMP